MTSLLDAAQHERHTRSFFWLGLDFFWVLSWPGRQWGYQTSNQNSTSSLVLESLDQA